MKQCLGIGVAKRGRVLGARFDDGRRHGKALALANDERGFASPLERLGELDATPEGSLVVVESAGHCWMALWESPASRGHGAAMVSPALTGAFRKADALRKTKTDPVDAFPIAEYARFKRLGPTRASPEDAEGLKRLTRHRRHLAVERAALKNRLASAADRIFPELAGLFSDKRSATARAVLDEYGSAAKVAAADIRALTKTAGKASRGRHGRAKAVEVKEAAKKSVGVAFAAGALALEAGRIAGLIDHLDGEVGELDAETARLLDPEAGALLQSIPGIGPVCAATTAAEVGGPGRLDGPKKLMAYAGMDPARLQSGKLGGDGQRMSKRGSAPPRNAPMAAADGARRLDPCFGDHHDSLRGRGEHRYVAASGCARKLCGVILAVLRERRPCEPRPSVQSRQEQPDGG